MLLLLHQSCPTLRDPIDGSPPGSPIPGILQARTLEWIAIPFSNAWKWKVKVKSLSCVWLLATPWAAAYEAPPSMGFSRQEYWSGVPLPSPSAKRGWWISSAGSEAPLWEAEDRHSWCSWISDRVSLELPFPSLSAGGSVGSHAPGKSHVEVTVKLLRQGRRVWGWRMGTGQRKKDTDSQKHPTPNGPVKPNDNT